MNQAKPLFIMGNKRSGSSILVRLLNLHPKVFVSDESDIIWILYQARNGKPAQYTCYPWDDSVGMEATLAACHEILEDSLYKSPGQEAIAMTFLRVQAHIMKYGSAKQPPHPHPKSELAWIGDKKPVQHSDPELRAFLHSHFPNARYIHIVRHPRAVVASKIKAAKSWGGIAPQYWEKTPQDILERWAIHEEWVLQAKALGAHPIYTLRLEDLCQEPSKKTAELFNFLELEMPTGITDQIRELGKYDLSPLNDKRVSETFPLLRNPDAILLNLLVKPDPNRKYRDFSLPISPRAARIMQVYGY